ncbi:MAG TPA: hypothetical protein VI072_01050 [Polyangiaceae bacterium]
MTAVFSMRCAVFALLAILTTWPAFAESAPLVVVVEDGGARADAVAVRREIERELGVPVVDATTGAARGTLLLSIDSRSVHARYTASDGRELTRAVDLPRDPLQRLDVIVWLAGNLVRDEASDMAAALKPPKPVPPAGSPVSEPVAEPQPDAAPAPKPEPGHEPESEPERGAETQTAPQRRRLELRAPILANLSLFHPIALYRDSHRRRVHLELGLAYSRVGELSGVALNAGAVRSDGTLQGAVFAGLFTLLDDGADGVAASGLFSRAGGLLRGAEAAGIFVWRSGNVQGAQGAGIAVHAHDVTGAQAAGIVASARRATGAQAVGLVARAEALAGIQMSGITNVAGTLAGLQVSLVNVAGDVSGTQVGLVNIGRRVSGAQVGLVNRAEHVRGLSLAPVSVLSDNRTQAVIWADSVLAPNVGVRYGTEVLYSLFSVGIRPGPREERLFGAGGAVGIELGRVGPVAASADVFYRYLLPDFEGEPYRDQHSTVLRGLAAWELGTVGLFAGLGAESRVQGDNSHRFRPYAAAGVTVF